MGLPDWAAGFCLTTTAFHLSSVILAARRLRRSGARDLIPLPRISLIRPVCGIDNFAEDTLGSSFRIAYPDYEVLFCVARADDPAVPLLHRLIEANPAVPARLLIGEHRISTNPKLNNLVKGWYAARHRWIVIVDSNVLLPPDCLDRLLARWRPETGAVCSMPIGARPHGFWAEVECAFLNTLQARVQYLCEALGYGFAQGKTMLLRRDIVERAGGLSMLAADAAEDAAVTKMMRSAGFDVHLIDRPFEQPLGRRAVAEVWSRQLRWARLRRGSFPALFLTELLAGSILPLLAASVAAVAYGISISTTVASLLTVWLGAELALARLAGWRCGWRILPALLVRDLLLPALWIGALIGDSFVWRGNAMTIGDSREAAVDRDIPDTAAEAGRQF